MYNERGVVMKKKTGFTLIELLAVIAVLAIILIITIPTIMSSTKKAKEKNAQNAVNSVASWAEKQYALTQVQPEKADILFQNIEKNNTKILKKEELKRAGFNIEGKDGEVTLTIDQEGKVCVEFIPTKEGGKFSTGEIPIYQSGNCEKKEVVLKEETKTGTKIMINNTYNGTASVKIYGKSVQEGTPTPDNPVEIKSVENFELVSTGKNLFDAYNYITNYPDDIKVINQDGEDWIKMQSSTKQIRYNLKAKENTQHTFTFEFKRYDDTGAYSAVFALYYTDGTSETIDFGYYGDGILHKVSKTSAENKTISYIRSANYGNTVYFLLRVNGSQIEEGITATTYEPYKEKVTTTIDLTGREPLRKIGDLADYIDYSNSKIVRNIKSIEM